ncbi:MAG: DUF3048 C-terminal domain-containing protein [Anaerolineales bacterium]|nr:DUF3048 C-terminal domain-containing protein [Anaerolineales bacterium]MCB9145097.1 DUF3048 C-terminal domain-containing protein [Anaerolineales bacterium]
MMNLSKKLFVFALALSILSACGANPENKTPTLTLSASPTNAATFTTAPTSTPQAHSTPIALGPNQENFPANINPLTGLQVEDPSWLKLPAVLVSVSNSPVTARPQAGLSFAAWVFEFYIGEGATRFMSVFYGGAPRHIPNVGGGCNGESSPPAEDWVGNRVWLDENANGVQNDWEAGVSGVCVRLMDGISREVRAEAVTDSNGYFWLPRSGGEAILQFIKPKFYEFTQANIGDEDHDSDANQATGETDIFTADASASFFDAGLILTREPAPTPTVAVTGTPPNWYIPQEAYIGPIRSGRLTYNNIGAMFPNSCLVYASAARDIGQMLNGCEIIYGVDSSTPNSALLPVTHLRELAEQNVNAAQPVNYSGNLFADAVPVNGKPALAMDVYYHAYTQAYWEYDSASGSYLRWTDTADGTGTFLPHTDRLTGRQLAFENIVVLFADHNRYRHNQFEIDLGSGQAGFAYLFRDGLVYKIRWTTRNREWEKETGLPRPIYFLDEQNNPIALHPGQTWIHLMTPYSIVEDQGDGNWLLKFVQPADPQD